MKRFWLLNKGKFLSFYAAILFACAIIVLLVTFLLQLNEVQYSLDSVIKLTIIGTTTFYVIVMSVGALEWFNKIKIRNMLKEQSPMNELEKIGFIPDLLNYDTKWYFTEASLSMTISDFKIMLDVDVKNDRYIQFKIKVRKKKFSIEQNTSVANSLNSNYIQQWHGHKVKQYNEKDFEQLTIEQLEQELHEFVALLKFHGFQAV